MTIAFTFVCGSDLLLARGRACGPHPCCTKGACKMTPKSGARVDRCDAAATNTEQQQSPVLFPSIDGFVIGAQPPTANGQPITAAVTDGASFGVDRPPRVTG
jgi:hypothetical protein